MPLPLHIFEERYKAMIRECLEQKAPFGIVLIKEGQEVGGPAEPFSVGTTAIITQVQSLEGGRMNILTQGLHRFNILEIVQRSPYLKGRVEYLDEDESSPPQEMVNEARELLGSYIKSTAGLRGGWTTPDKVPHEPAVLSYQVAQVLELTSLARQELLEIPSAAGRLEKELATLREQSEHARRIMIRRTPYQGFRLN